MNVIKLTDATDEELKICAVFIGMRVKRMTAETARVIRSTLAAYGMTHIDVTDSFMIQAINLMATVLNRAAVAVRDTIKLDQACLHQMMPATASFRCLDNLKLVVLRYTPIRHHTAAKSEHLVVQQFTALFGTPELVYAQNMVSYERRWEIQKDHYIVVGRRARTLGRVFIGFAEVADLATGEYENSLLIDIDAHYGTRPRKTKSRTQAVDCAFD